MAAAIVIDGDEDTIRGMIATATGRLGYRFHYGDLRSKERRFAAIEELVAIEGWDGYIVETGRPLPPQNYSEHHVRAKTLGAALTLLGGDLGVRRAILETRSHPIKGFQELDLKDHQVLQKLVRREAVPKEFRIGHRDKGEAILGIADMLAGARSDFLCRADLECFPLLAHRVRRIETVMGRL